MLPYDTTKIEGATDMKDSAGFRESSLAFRLLTRLGSGKAVAALTALCTVCSTLLTAIAGYLFGFSVAELLEAMAIASGISTVISFSASFWVVKLASDLIEARKTLIRLASRDELTDLHNRRHFTEQLERLVQAAASSNRTIGVLLIDVDRLKSINDLCGHHAGDEVLLRVATAIRDAIRQDDVAARYAGDEFAVILDSVDEHDAHEICDRIRASLTSAGINNHWLPKDTSLSVSIGLAFCGPDERPASLLRRADAALYEAKKRGRDMVVAAPDLANPSDTTPAPT